MLGRSEQRLDTINCFPIFNFFLKIHYYFIIITWGVMVL
uniref:Uncharacterized protein n=1 Tax=Rhizophora mucronata TaxID=61149 RepID=A0A2P2QAU3_RHIMU